MESDVGRVRATVEYGGPYQVGNEGAIVISIIRRGYSQCLGLFPDSNNWNKPFNVLRERWGRVPCDGTKQLDTKKLLGMDDAELLNTWNGVVRRDTKGEGYSVRGWYHAIYKSQFFGKKIVSVGSGFGIDGITFAANGAYVTFCDIVKDNLKVIERLSTIQCIKADYLYIENTDSLKSLGEYDVIWCQGSLINAPYRIATEERRELVKHLKVGGHWIELAYPKSRWVRDGKPPFHVWGKITDGKGTPWMEWYDLGKLRESLGGQFSTVRDMEFHNGEFIWFDLVKQ